MTIVRCGGLKRVVLTKLLDQRSLATGLSDYGVSET
jgi:hypothetical protein